MDNEQKLNVSWDFILKAIILVVLLYFLYTIQELIIWFIFALIISILFNFAIDFLEKLRIPRVVATLFVYISLLGLVAAFLYFTVPSFITQLKDFASNIPYYFKSISPVLEKLGITAFEKASSGISFLEENIGKAGQGIFNALVVVFGGLKAAVFIIFLSFFLSLESKFLERFLAKFSPKRYKARLFNFLPKAKKKISGWFVSRVAGMVFVGLLSFLLFQVAGLKYALILSLIFAVSDFIPILGPIVSTVLIFIIIAIDSFPQAIFILIGLFIIQQLEGNFLFPIIFNKIIGIPPYLVLISLVVGAELWGIFGAILAVPLAGIIFEFVKDLQKFKQRY